MWAEGRWHEPTSEVGHSVFVDLIIMADDSWTEGHQSDHPPIRAYERTKQSFSINLTVWILITVSVCSFLILRAHNAFFR
jgi:hypothetical protein